MIGTGCSSLGSCTVEDPVGPVAVESAWTSLLCSADEDENVGENWDGDCLGSLLGISPADRVRLRLPSTGRVSAMVERQKKAGGPF